MQRKQNAKYLIAIYTIVASLAVIMWLFANLTTNETYQATLLNLSTELLGVVFIFFIVNYFFSLEEFDTNQRIDKLLGVLESEKSLHAKDFFIEKPILENLIEDATAIDLCGVALATTIDSNLSAIKAALRKGTPVRVLVMGRDDTVLRVAANRSELDDRPYYENKLESTIHNLKILHRYASTDSQKANLRVGFMSYPPSFGIKLFHKEGSNEEVCIVELFAHHVGWGKPPIFSLDKRDESEWFGYFQRQFEAMWQNSSEFDFGRE